MRRAHPTPRHARSEPATPTGSPSTDHLPLLRLRSSPPWQCTAPIHHASSSSITKTSPRPKRTSRSNWKAHSEGCSHRLCRLPWESSRYGTCPISSTPRRSSSHWPMLSHTSSLGTWKRTCPIRRLCTIPDGECEVPWTKNSILPLSLESMTRHCICIRISRSHGKEKLGDEPDVAKASYYFNPITDT